MDIDKRKLGFWRLIGLVSLMFIGVSCSDKSRIPPSSKKNKDQSIFISSGFGKPVSKKKNKSQAPQFGFYKRKSEQSLINKAYHSVSSVFGSDYLRMELGIDSDLSQQSYNNKYKNEGLQRMKAFRRGKVSSGRKPKRKKDNSSDAFAKPSN